MTSSAEAAGADAATSQIPVTVLTGYLGAGKTTLLNRILTEDHGHKYAVIVNEFGEIGIDTDLLVDTDEEVFEMNNGCICCTVRGDLIRTVENLLKRKNGIDAILVETTGLADPVPVAQTFFMDEAVREATRLDAVVTVADARHLPARLADSPEAEDQIAFADVVILNKTDLVTPAELAEVEAQIRALNPYARIHRTERAAISLDKVLNRGAFDLDRILTLDPDFLSHHDHEPGEECGPDCDHEHHHHGHDHDHAGHDHDDHDHACGPDCDHEHHHHGHDHHHHHDHVSASGITSVSLKGGALDPNVFFRWINQVTQTQGPDILRLKGILSFKDDPDRYVVQGVHMIIEGNHQRPWKDDEARESRLVFIGRKLDAHKLEEAFAACAAA